MTTTRLEAAIEHWRLANEFRISRGTKSEATVIVTTISDGKHVGRGECIPYPRYGETIKGVHQAILAMKDTIAQTQDRTEILRQMPPGAARNAIDCALWDLEAKRLDTTACAIANKTPLAPLLTAYTLSLDTPHRMAEIAAEKSIYPLLKLKLGGDGEDTERMRLVRAASPDTTIIVDANEGWTEENIDALIEEAAENNIALIEQPLPADQDDLLREVEHLVPICADESVHDRIDLPRLQGKYEAVNIKLDKAGGLTEALATAAEAKELGFKMMVGCMVGTSLAMAPASLLGQDADWIDLDGPLLLAKDREPSLFYDGPVMHPPSSKIWG